MVSIPIGGVVDVVSITVVGTVITVVVWAVVVGPKVVSQMTSSGPLTATTMRPTSNPIAKRAARELITVNVFSNDVR